jgi:hypothetical protein
MKLRVTDQSVYSACHKFLEKLIYNRISPIIEENLPIEQAGFIPNRNCCDQVLALTPYIESIFQKRLKTGVVLLISPQPTTPSGKMV